MKSRRSWTHKREHQLLSHQLVEASGEREALTWQEAAEYRWSMLVQWLQ
jgi:hypothetical protein